MTTEMTCQPALAPDRTIAADFLKRLDPERGKWLFASIDDQKRQKGMRLKYGSLDECWSWVCDQQRDGWGVFFTVNRTKGASRAGPDVEEARALFLDVDKPEMPEPVWPGACPPLIEVVSSLEEVDGVVRPKRHFYWPCRGLALNWFDISQGALVKRYVENGADKAVKDLPRVLRLPGTLHLKNPAKPHLVTFKSLSDRESYSGEELCSAFPPLQSPGGQAYNDRVKKARQDALRSNTIAAGGEVGEPEECCIQEALSAIPSEDRDTWLRVGAALHQRYSGDAQGLQIWDDWSLTTAKNNYTPEGRDDAWKSFKLDRKNPAKIGTIYALAKKYGWKGTPWQVLKSALTEGSAGLELIEAPPEVVAEAPSSRRLPPVVFPHVTGKGVPKNHWRNAQAALQALEVKVAFDEFQQETFIEGLGNHRIFTDAAATDLRCAFQDLGFDLKLSDVYEYADKIARDNCYHPVREYLDNLRWDGKPRIDELFSRYAGAEDTPLNRAAGAIFMIAAVRRVRDPGVKFDLVVVLEGREDIGKSTFFRHLAVRNEWFSDSVSLGLDSKEMIELTAGKWIVEIPELAGHSKRESEDVKAMITRQSDTARSAYARKAKEVPRQFVLVSTTNEGRGTGYLRSQTGNRRFLPVPATAFDTPALIRDRDQLWAEAADREAKDEAIFLSLDLKSLARAEQEERRMVDPTEEIVLNLIGEGGEFISGAQIQDALKSAGISYKQAHGVLCRVFLKAGWNNTRKKSSGRYLRGWEAPVGVTRSGDHGDADAPFDDHEVDLVALGSSKANPLVATATQALC